MGDGEPGGGGGRVKQGYGPRVFMLSVYMGIYSGHKAGMSRDSGPDLWRPAEKLGVQLSE